MLQRDAVCCSDAVVASFLSNVDILRCSVLRCVQCFAVVLELRIIKCGYL